MRYKHHHIFSFCIPSSLPVPTHPHSHSHIPFPPPPFPSICPQVILPKDLASQCCGMMFNSRGLGEAAALKGSQLEDALMEASQVCVWGGVCGVYGGVVWVVVCMGVVGGGLGVWGGGGGVWGFGGGHVRDAWGGCLGVCVGGGSNEVMRLVGVCLDG